MPRGRRSAAAFAALGGLNEPHMIFGKTKAQAYDTAAYKCAADDLLLARGVGQFSSCAAAGVSMDGGGSMRSVETKSGRVAVRGQISSIAPGRRSCRLRRRAVRDSRGDGNMLYPP